MEKSEYIYREVPSAILQCKALPVEPVAADRQSEVAKYILELYQTADDCKQNLRRVQEVLERKE